MALEFLSGLFGRRNQLPTDQVTRIPRRAKKAAAVATAGMKETLTTIGALPGLADVAQTKRLPRGFFDLVDVFLAHVDDYHAAVRAQLPEIGDDVVRPGEGGGDGPCHTAPMGVSSLEALAIYRRVRPLKDFQQIAHHLGELGEMQFKDIQAGHGGKDPEKIRMGSKAVRGGRLSYAKRMEACAYLDPKKGKCRIWEHRPIACRMHHPLGAPALHQPNHEGYPQAAEVKNIRLPVKIQVELQQLDKRLMLQVSPFLFAGTLQLLQLTEGQMLQETGEAPQRMQQDGQVVQKANRNVKHAAKFKKKKKKKK
ncbi:MAG: YkgJ family cysteine cluster protein [Nannocystaceae bacterium]|nr:YkgJ family cysteine cluster protein [Nannocystaceae bacterium]